MIFLTGRSYSDKVNRNPYFTHFYYYFWYN